MPSPQPTISMPIEDFLVMKHRLGWKHEYWDQTARLSPQYTAVADFELPVARTFVAEPKLSPGYELRPVDHSDCAAIVKLFQRAFDQSIEYTGWSDSDFQKDAEASAESFFGRRHSAGRTTGYLNQSFVVTLSDAVVAALQIRPDHRGPVVEPVMVDPEHHRQGLGKAMLCAVLAVLRQADIPTLYSRCHLGNSASLNWHAGVGFHEVPNYFSACHRVHHFEWMVRHFEHLGHADAAECMRQKANEWKKWAVLPER
ncbi:MAG: GNAT family N-acetyltransferase [Planctomycetaceae bacterium]